MIIPFFVGIVTSFSQGIFIERLSHARHNFTAANGKLHTGDVRRKFRCQKQYGVCDVLCRSAMSQRQ